MVTEKSTMVKMVLDAWETHQSRVAKLIASLSDDQLLKETSPGRNTGTYLVGHLVAVSDAMMPLLGLGQRLHPELDEVYLKNPDKSGLPTPSTSNLRTYWSEVHGELSKRFGQVSTDEWFTRHNSVSEVDFIKEPHRNKLNVVINRANHMSYHHGQLVYLAK